jgi:hypothetical protein
MAIAFCRSCGNCPALFLPQKQHKICSVCGQRLTSVELPGAAAQAAAGPAADRPPLPGIFVDYVPSRSSARTGDDETAGSEPGDPEPAGEPLADHFQFIPDTPAHRRLGVGLLGWGVALSVTFLAVGGMLAAGSARQRFLAMGRQAKHARADREVKARVESHATDSSRPVENVSLPVALAQAKPQSEPSAAAKVALPAAESPPAPRRVLPDPIVERIAAEPAKEKPATIVVPPREEPVARLFEKPALPERAPAVACKDGACALPKDSSSSGGDYGTRLVFAENPTVAEKEAKEKSKLLFLLNISGNFEESKFT